MLRIINVSRILKLSSISAGLALFLGTVYILQVHAPRNVLPFEPRNAFSPKSTVYIVGKAAIADYLWLHILKGKTVEENNGFYRTGVLETDELTLKFLAGPGYIQTTIPQGIEYLVLVLNGRSHNKRLHATQWLDYVYKLSNLRKFGVLLLGDERCENDWILPYMRRYGGSVDVLFVVYDWKRIDDNDIFQWPLGVATYRGFPLPVVEYEQYPDRKYLCNFAGTVYYNSSRVQLLNVINDLNFSHNCANYARNKWSANETPSSLSRYVDLLKDSYFTLCPAGKNTECYRIYEALSLGSVPIVEDVPTGGDCQSSLGLLKSYNAPFMFVNNWNTLNSLLKKLASKPEKISALQLANVLWYQQFKQSLKNKFLDTIREKFEL